MTGDQPVDEVFGLLSDPTRVDVLRTVALAEHDVEGPKAGPATLSFSELYDRVDVDGTSKLSYHLGELVGTYLRKGEDGYALTHAGERVVRFVLSGNYEQPPAFGPTSVPGTCVFCGASPLEASLSGQFFRIDCPACGEQVAGQPVSPAQLRSRDPEAVVRSVERRSVRDYREIRGGTCPECSGRLSAEVLDVGGGPLPEAESFLVHSECGECLREYNAPLTYSAAYHPASVAFHWDRGVDVTTTPPWAFNGHLREGRWTSERRSSDPERYEVVLRRDGDAVRLRLDATATVTRTERVRRRGGDEPHN
jgi:DNA-binding transcriptional ArsR family regulator